ncbi:hypothetical protein ACXXDK_03765 [Deinococcus sp. PESE-38]
MFFLLRGLLLLRLQVALLAGHRLLAHFLGGLGLLLRLPGGAGLGFGAGRCRRLLLGLSAGRRLGLSTGLRFCFSLGCRLCLSGGARLGLGTGFGFRASFGFGGGFGLSRRAGLGQGFLAGGLGSFTGLALLLGTDAGEAFGFLAGAFLGLADAAGLGFTAAAFFFQAAAALLLQPGAFADHVAHQRIDGLSSQRLLSLGADGHRLLTLRRALQLGEGVGLTGAAVAQLGQFGLLLALEAPQSVALLALAQLLGGQFGGGPTQLLHDLHVALPGHVGVVEPNEHVRDAVRLREQPHVLGVARAVKRLHDGAGVHLECLDLRAGHANLGFGLAQGAGGRRHAREHVGEFVFQIRDLAGQGVEPVEGRALLGVQLPQPGADLGELALLLHAQAALLDELALQLFQTPARQVGAAREVGRRVLGAGLPLQRPAHHAEQRRHEQQPGGPGRQNGAFHSSSRR